MSDPSATVAGARTRTAIIGGGWAGMAAAISASDAGHDVSVWEAARTWGGRARSLSVRLTDDTDAVVDNGQHILIGAYSECLRLMRRIGLDPDALLMRLPLEMQFPDGNGMRFPVWPAPLDALAGIVRAQGWTLADKLSLTRAAIAWRLRRFDCPVHWTVAYLCRSVTPRVMAELVEPLCVSALNSPPETSSAQVFLRVMRDAVFGAHKGSNLLLPRTDMSALFPDAAARWLKQRGAQMKRGLRIRQLAHDGRHWQVDSESFDQVILATAAPDAIHVLQASLPWVAAPVADALRDWISIAARLQHAAITTVYAWSADATLARPMLALRSGRHGDAAMPAQFVFDRGQLGGPRGLLAFVVSTSSTERDRLQAVVLAQAQAQLGLRLEAVSTVVEKRATIVCHPGLVRPPMAVATGLLACGDYVTGPYPSTLEGAVRSGMAAVNHPAVAVRTG
ncbi:MAG: hydroxysqualene dehydroxylase HpnE [Burkholderiaceae bacterium]